MRPGGHGRVSASSGRVKGEALLIFCLDRLPLSRWARGRSRRTCSSTRITLQFTKKTKPEQEY